MKKQKKNMGSLIKKAGVKGMAAGAVSLVLVAGGFHVLWDHVPGERKYTAKWK